MARKSNEKIAEIRRKANEQRKIEETKRKRRRIILQSSIVVVVLLIVGGIAWAAIAINNASTSVTQPQASASVSIGSESDIPFTVDGTAVTVGADDAPVQIDLWEDFSCPHCKEYEAAVGDTMQDLIASGDVAVAYHPIQIVQSYGIRAGSVSTCVAVNDPQNWLAVHTALFEAQGATSESMRADEFADLVGQAGVTDEKAIDCVRSGTYENWIEQNTAASADAGVTGTPTLFINGEKSDPLDADALSAKVAEIVGG